MYEKVTVCRIKPRVQRIFSGDSAAVCRIKPRVQCSVYSAKLHKGANYERLCNFTSNVKVRPG
jgi:hypothetical protein